MIPGTKNQRLLRSGLYQGRGASSDRRHHLHQLRRNAGDAVPLVLLREAQRDLRDVARGNQRGIRVGRVHDHLQRRGLAAAQLLGKAGIDLQPDGGLPLLNQIA